MFGPPVCGVYTDGGPDMSEQDSADVGRFLDGLDVERDERVGEDASRRSRAAMQRWEYMTWTTTETRTGRSVRLMNGERLDEYRPEAPALAEAGAQGWELLAVVATGGKHDHTLYFKRPKVED
jgi:hypothetical protein